MSYPTIEIKRDLIDVTSNHRPDLSWIFVDKSGHYHRWYNGETLATQYRQQISYSIPSIEWIKTGTDFYPDGSEFEVGYNRCKLCHEEVNPGYTSDRTTQYITGLTHYYVDGKEVSEKEVEAIMRSYGEIS